MPKTIKINEIEEYKLKKKSDFKFNLNKKTIMKKKIIDMRILININIKKII